MAFIVKTSVKVNYSMKLTNYYTDKSRNSTVLSINDDVTNLKYIDRKTEEVKSVSGRIDNIVVEFLKVSKDFNILTDAVVTSITVDASKSKKSNVVVINTKDLLKYNAEEGKEVYKVGIDPIVTVDFKSELSDGTISSIVFEQGMNLFNTVINKGIETVTGDFKVKSFKYRIDYNYGKVKIYGMILSGETEEHVVFEDIKKCGSKGIVVDDSTSISDAISSATEPVVGLVLPASNITEVLNINKKVTIVGPKESIVASSGGRASDVIASDESVLMNNIIGEKDADIVIKGAAFTDKAIIDVNGASTITFKNCKFVETESSDPKSYMIKDKTFREESDKPVLLQFDGCYFGTNSPNGSNKMYNLFEINAKIANGSYIKNCYFAKNCTTHNIINFYDIEEGATVEISGNHFEKSTNAIRLGFIGNPNCTIIIKDNVYDETDSDPAWAGILLIQPYGTRTTSFENLHVIMRNNKYTAGECQDGYLYCGSGDTQITAETAPKIECDGYFNFGF